MKKRLIALAGAILLTAGALSAQTTDSASLFLSGVVGPYVNIEVTPTANATNLLLNIAQGSPVTVAEVVEVSNESYTVSVSSVNNFAFSNGDHTHDYILYYGGTAFPEGGQVSTGGFANHVTRTVGITYDSAGTLQAGTYTDTVTFTIESNS
ncbi:hypothetical protein SAMN05920897_10817 [Alkalispirochaeta americana]|uniref:Spore Coat Protein U domain-containing protein n=1 Tax=Alkalispirochaeta americana TaxID=159291 RepID=A0A1N6SCA6_9SPIO|nr:hypothetical protein [Alkalispirochaeta americana]SIQ38691.1 hypothetical protein SAMN05920897_10817 [Alkalispirochaeta americana]